MRGILLFWDTLQHEGPFHQCREKGPKPHKPAYTIYTYTVLSKKQKKLLTEKSKAYFRNTHLTCGAAVVSVKLSSLILISPTSSSEGHVPKRLLDLEHSKTFIFLSLGLFIIHLKINE